VTRPPFRPDSSILRSVVRRLADRYSCSISRGKENVLVEALPTWQPLSDVVDTLLTLSRSHRIATRYSSQVRPTTWAAIRHGGHVRAGEELQAGT
jgi:hypothetical protein